MALNTEIILTLQQLKGFGTKTIIGISQIGEDINTIEELCHSWKSRKGKRFESISTEDLYSANKAALRVLDACQRENIGIISYDEPLFPTMLRNCIKRERKTLPYYCITEGISMRSKSRALLLLEQENRLPME